MLQCESNLRPLLHPLPQERPGFGAERQRVDDEPVPDRLGGGHASRGGVDEQPVDEVVGVGDEVRQLRRQRHAGEAVERKDGKVGQRTRVLPQNQPDAVV